jgi:hypothetical protein
MVTTGAAAQWRTPNKAGTIRTEIDPKAPAPRTADGRPDLSGLWGGGAGTPFESLPPGVSRLTMNNAAVGVPMTDEAEALVKTRAARLSRDNPRSHCLPMGIVQLYTSALPVKFLQTPGELVLLFEGNSERREIFTDGRSLPGPGMHPLWNGYSVARWDGDTLVAETIGFRDGGWLDMSGTPFSDTARITERFRRPSLGRLDIDITVEDKKVFLRPFTVRVTYGLRPDDELLEHVCLENNKFRP